MFERPKSSFDRFRQEFCRDLPQFIEHLPKLSDEKFERLYKTFISDSPPDSLFPTLAVLTDEIPGLRKALEEEAEKRGWILRIEGRYLPPESRQLTASDE